MTALTETGERFGQLECIALVSAPDEPEERYRLLCHRCKYDGVLCNVSTLLTCKVTQCFDCAEQSRLTPQQRTVIAFRRSLQMSPEPLPIGWVA